MAHRLTIALMAKNSVNNLHRQDLVDVFRAHGLEVEFLVLEGHPMPRQRLHGCRYRTCSFSVERGAILYWRGFFRYFRSLYANPLIPAQTRAVKRGAFRRLMFDFLILVAQSRLLMRLVLVVEGLLYRSNTVEGLDPGQVDQLLIQTIGGRDSESGARLTRWAQRHGISVVHVTGNYDHLPTKGFRGVRVDHLLVWGPVMREDAVRLQAIPPDRVREIGATRYDAIARQIVHDRATFLKAIGLDPAKRTILFAGSPGEPYYFEMLQAFEELQAENDGYQLILRLYPDKALMASPYTKPLMHYARQARGVYVSIADPDHRTAGEFRGLPEIEQDELWHALRHCDVVVNIYSTITLEACLFDRPAIYLSYHPTKSHGWLRPPVYFDYLTLAHTRRMLEHGAVPKAYDRAELIRLIREAIARPDRYRDQRAFIVRQELGDLDGHVGERLADACLEAFEADRPRRAGRWTVKPAQAIPAADSTGSRQSLR